MTFHPSRPPETPRRRDPLRASSGGFLAQSTAVDAYVTTPRGRYAGPPLGGRPMHVVTALV